MPLSLFRTRANKAFGLERSPEPFDHAIVSPRAFTVHADLDLRIGSDIDPAATGKLATLIGVEDLWCAVFGQGLFQGPDTELRVHAV